MFFQLLTRCCPNGIKDNNATTQAVRFFISKILLIKKLNVEKKIFTILLRKEEKVLCKTSIKLK